MIYYLGIDSLFQFKRRRKIYDWDHWYLKKEKHHRCKVFEALSISVCNDKNSLVCNKLMALGFEYKYVNKFLIYIAISHRYLNGNIPLQD